jgi:eukaryotic-like serine/threonine-protein kinase
LTLTAGTRLGPFEIIAPLGAGGMGEVYRALDTNLARQVAIKILPDSVAHDHERLVRFEREAKTLAALNHPNIAQIYGLERSDTSTAIAMELVEGLTLADRIGQGAISVEEALPIAKQIAEALEAAHEQGVIHRDLKPANIKVRSDGMVKVLDFGLAKALEPASERSIDVTASPTITSPALMTGVGVLLGTAAYMSPEQAKGRAVDRRADIWALGAVLFEMLTGKRAFAGEDVADTLAFVLTKEPDWTALPTNTPASIKRLLRRCLEKDRKRRLADSADARLEIEEALAAPSSAAEARQAPRLGRPRVAWTAATIAAIAALALAALHFSERPPPAAAAIRFTVTPPEDMILAGQGQWLSPDGRQVAFRVAPRSAPTPTGPSVRLAVRSFHEANARILAGTDDVRNAFWSPDSRYLAFFAAGKLQKIDITGGPAQVLCDAPVTGASSGGTWNPEGTIVFAIGESNLGGTGLFRVSSAGGTPVQITKPDAARNEVSHKQPRFLPDGRHFLFVATGSSSSKSSVLLGSLDSGSLSPVLQSDTEAIYADRFLLFVRDRTLLAQPFNPNRLEVSGDPVVVAQNIDVNIPGALSNVSASTTGLLAYRATSARGADSQLAWFDRSGKRLGTIGDTADQTDIQLSPDGTRAAVSVLDPSRRTRDIWIYDLTRNGLRTRFTFDAGDDWSSVWSPDGRSLIFSAGRASPLDLYQKSADGSGDERKLLEGSGASNKYVRSWSADGRFVLFHSGEGSSPMGNDLWLVSLSEDRKPRALLQTAFNELDGRFSPDGRWVAYRSNESGRIEIYVMPFAAQGGKWQVSTAGGDQPRWRRDGRELFYLAGNTIMAAEVNGSGPAFQVGAVRPLFDVTRRTAPSPFGVGSVYDVTADGQRFLVSVVAEAEEAPSPITVITNWTTTLR